MKRKQNKKIFLEVISNINIFNIKFRPMKFPTINILPNLQGGLKKERADNSEYSMFGVFYDPFRLGRIIRHKND